MGYIELHACSAFSFLRGGSFPEHIAETAAELAMPAVALLDRNGVYGTQRFSVTAREHGIRPINLAELCPSADECNCETQFLAHPILIRAAQPHRKKCTDQPDARIAITDEPWRDVHLDSAWGSRYRVECLIRFSE